MCDNQPTSAEDSKGE
jgi:hypothetical protein